MEPESGIQAISSQDAILTLASPPFVFCLGISILVLFYLRRNPSVISESRAFLKATTWKLEDSVALAMMLVFLLFLIRSIITVLHTHGIITDDQILPLSIILQTFIFHAPVVAAVTWMLHRRNESVTSSLGIQGHRLLENIAKGVLAYLASMPAIAAANIASWFILQRMNVPPEPQFALQVLMEPNPAWLKLYLVAMAVILAPLAEELLFRAVCFPALAKRTAPLRAAILISLLFAAIHLNAYAFIPLFVMALALCAAYAWTRSIIVPLTMHAIFNGVNISIYILYKILQEHSQV